MRFLKISNKTYLILPLIYILISLLSPQVLAQYFGTNKVQYKKIKFNILETQHYNIYNYFKDRHFIYNLADLSEMWYKHHSNILNMDLSNKNPIIIYANHADFSQTTLSPYNIDIGTGGVTEGLKNRIFMPVFESRQQTKHVIGHELVHAFQYDMLKNTDGLSLENVLNIPLWMIEGMAEYMSKGSIDASTAISLRDSYINKKFPTIKDLNNLNKYFPYKYGQAFWAFIASNWEEKIIKTLFVNTAKYGYSNALEKTLSCTEDELSTIWKNQISYLYEPLLKNNSKPVGKEILNKKSKGDVNLAPQISPDGKFITFFSDKDAINIDLYIADIKTGKIIKQISGHNRKLHIDEYNFIEDIGSWSPNGDNYVYTAISKGKTALLIIDVNTGKTIDEHFIKELEYFSHPTYSPDGKSILLTAIKDGISNLFLYNLGDKSIKQLTYDLSSKMQASWSPDGKNIIFASDNSNYQDLSTKQKNYKTNILNITTNHIETIDILKGADNLNALFSHDGNKIFFLSNFNGYRNLFQYDLNSKEVFQLTNYFTGISGITDLSNALSVSQKDDLIIYVFFYNNKYNLYSAYSKDFKKHKIDNNSISNNSGAKLGINDNYTNITLNSKEVEQLHLQYKNKKYTPNFSFTNLSQSAGIGIGTSMAATSVIAAGSIEALFTDILDRNKMLLSIGINGELYDISTGIFYLNQANRINWSLGVSHMPYLYTYLNSYITKPKNNNAKLNYDHYKLRIFNETFGGAILFPIFRTLRLEAGANISLQNYRVDYTRNTYEAINRNGNYVPGNLLSSKSGKLKDSQIQEMFNINTKGLLNLSTYIAYVGDNSIFGLTAPVQGYRYRFEAGKTFLGINSVNILADARKYFFLKPLTFAIKGVYIGQFGSNAFQISTLYLGYDEFVRGYSYIYNDIDFDSDTPISNTQQLTGSQLFNTSIEFRIPFSGPKQLAIIESKTFFTDLALFFDAGSIWGKPDNRFNNSLTNLEPLQTDYKKPRMLASTGISLRFNLFGVVVLEPYYAIPFSNFHKKPHFGFFISTEGW